MTLVCIMCGVENVCEGCGFGAVRITAGYHWAYTRGRHVYTIIYTWSSCGRLILLNQMRMMLFNSWLLRARCFSHNSSLASYVPLIVMNSKTICSFYVYTFYSFETTSMYTIYITSRFTLSLETSTLSRLHRSGLALKSAKFKILQATKRK